MNKNLRHFEKVNKIEINYPNKDTFIVYNDILDKIKIKINDLEIDVSEFELKSRYLKQIKFETVVFTWLERKGYIKSFYQDFKDAIIPPDEYCAKKNIQLFRIYGV